MYNLSHATRTPTKLRVVCSKVFDELVCVVNMVFSKGNLLATRGPSLDKIMVGFKQYSKLISIHGMIDCMEVQMNKWKGPFFRDYFSYKFKAIKLF